MQRAAVLWTGGKDSCLALHELKAGCNIVALVIFTPGEPRFHAHPLKVLEIQAQRLGLPLLQMTITEPAREGYVMALRQLQKKEGIELLITGDISEVDGHPNWIQQCAEPLGLETRMPLWGMEREEIWAKIAENKLRVIISYIKDNTLAAEWLGKEITLQTLPALKKECARTGSDLCGENGEFHTLTLDGALFSRPIDIAQGSPVQGGGYSYWEIGVSS